MIVLSGNLKGMLSYVSENPRAYMETHNAPREENIQLAGCSQLTCYGTYIKVLQWLFFIQTDVNH